jgi:hypothetical protein
MRLVWLDLVFAITPAVDLLLGIDNGFRLGTVCTVLGDRDMVFENI